MDFVEAFKRHHAENTFDYVFVNKNYSQPIPSTPEYAGYSFVEYDKKSVEQLGYHIIEGDFLEAYMGGVEGKGVSIYHDSEKISDRVFKEYEKFMTS